MARFFIDRPVFAWVISILILLAGGLAITRLPVAQYPTVAPPSISVSATYAGASAETVQDTVTTLLEQQMTGIDNLQYMTASSSSSGQSSLSLYFFPGTNPDTAQVQVQNKVQLAMPSLPQTVQQQGISVAKATRNFMQIIAICSTNGSMDQYAVGNYIASSVLDPLRRVTGVGEASMFGTEYSMRIWMDPEKMNRYSITALDIRNAVSAQNAQVSMGQLGDRPSVSGQELNVTLRGQSTLKTPAQFGEILLKVNTNGSQVRLKDVSRIELGGQSYGMVSRAMGYPGAGIAVKLSPSANALSTANAVRAKMDELSKFFPPGVKVFYPMDTSTFIRISIEEVVKTLLEAIVLVFLVVFLFLQNIRATLIPTIVIPVALLGTFACLYAFGFSINVLTMFGAVLAIGMLVDDAIVVVENVERIMNEEGLPPVEATRKAMDQITGALIGITLVLTAVFVPMAFFSGSVGTIYKQFSLSLVSAMIISVFLAMSLTPALCAHMLPPVEKGHKHLKKGFFGWFNRGFGAMTNKYQSWVGGWLKRPVRCMLLYVVIAAATAFLYLRLPTAFLPEEDQGFFITAVQLPVGATSDRTEKALKEIESYYKEQPEIESFMSVVGFSLNGSGQNGGICFVRLKDWNKRGGGAHTAQAVANRANGRFFQIKDAQIFALVPAAITELSMSSGFDFELQDLGGLGHEKLMDAKKQLVDMAAQNPKVKQVRMQGMEDEPQLKVDVDQEKASALGVNLSDLNTIISTAFGSDYVNNFVNGNRIQRVMLQLDAPFRMKPEDIGKLYVRNTAGMMVPLSSLVTLKWTSGSPNLSRYNALSIIIVFLCLAALYESWSIPVAVLLVVPLGIFGALVATSLRDFTNDVYFKVGFLTIIGLSTKNAILIVEFAKEAQERGLGLIESTLQAVHLRLRPILMTSFAFILGVSPLAFAWGAGSASQNSIGTGVIGGMLSATILAVFLVPVFFVVVRRLFKARPKSAPSQVPAVAPTTLQGGQAHE